jgi:hypothetical protein
MLLWASPRRRQRPAVCSGLQRKEKKAHEKWSKKTENGRKEERPNTKYYK